MDRHTAYKKQLKKCGFRSFKRAWARAVELGRKNADNLTTCEEEAELKELYRLVDLFWLYQNPDRNLVDEDGDCYTK